VKLRGAGPATRRPRKTTIVRIRQAGWVSLVGAGPGDPQLLTLRAAERLRAADLVLYDGLVPNEIVQMADEQAEKISVARRAGRKELTQAQVIDLMIEAASRGRRVVRLKAGDPLVFGRGGEEARALAEAGIPFEIVPGVTSALAAPALAGIPVTYRGVASAFVVVSGHASDAYEPVLSRLKPGVTVVVLMGLGERRAIAACLVKAGWPTETPAAVVINAARSNQQVWTGTLATMGVRDRITSRRDPGVLVVGEVVSQARQAAPGRRRAR
jgi:uroporphyrin-III C-methyltransferase/precorrin-2 dehydrogenase/sirohydrochlorin ferrochelatase